MDASVRCCEQRDLKKTPEYRNVMLRAEWLAGLARLSSPDHALPLSSNVRSCACPSSPAPILFSLTLHSGRGWIFFLLTQLRDEPIELATDAA